MKVILIIIGFAYIAALFPTIAQVYYQRKYLHWKVPMENSRDTPRILMLGLELPIYWVWYCWQLLYIFYP